MKDLIPIVCASDCSECPDCGEPWCDRCRMHYFECECVGPHNADDYELDVIEINGQLFGQTRGELNSASV